MESRGFASLSHERFAFSFALRIRQSLLRTPKSRQDAPQTKVQPARNPCATEYGRYVARRLKFFKTARARQRGCQTSDGWRQSVRLCTYSGTRGTRATAETRAVGRRHLVECFAIDRQLATNAPHCGVDPPRPGEAPYVPSCNVMSRALAPPPRCGPNPLGRSRWRQACDSVSTRRSTTTRFHVTISRTPGTVVITFVQYG
jgi:hypothetical protein